MIFFQKIEKNLKVSDSNANIMEQSGIKIRFEKGNTFRI